MWCQCWRLGQGWAALPSVKFHLLRWQMLSVFANLERCRGESPYGSWKTWPKTQLSVLSQAHTHMCTSNAHLYSVSLFCRQQECYRLTQRKSACGPLLTQGPSSLWSGQCPTVSLAAGGTQRRKRLSDFCIFIWILFYYYPLLCSFSSFPCLSCSFCSFTLLFKFTYNIYMASLTPVYTVYL